MTERDPAGIYRLPPNKDPLSLMDLAAVFGMQTDGPIRKHIDDGSLTVSFVGGRYYVFRDEAERFLRNRVAHHSSPSQSKEPK